mmetsp:Transcript_22452/g.36253  ORF Transcript_22452/g.36253 Transcript_22452/m.36253 type:complete len:84 (-) Transcript_22452:128-379(-)
MTRQCSRSCLMQSAGSAQVSFSAPPPFLSGAKAATVEHLIHPDNNRHFTAQGGFPMQINLITIAALLKSNIGNRINRLPRRVA